VLVALGEPATTARLSSILWPGYGDDPPRGTLDTAVYRLRKLVGTDAAIVSDNGRIALGDQNRHRFARAVANLRHLWIRLGKRERGDELERLALSRDERAPILKDIPNKLTESSLLSPRC
jgi:DNA-binding SARP family transcriptional activator